MTRKRILLTGPEYVSPVTTLLQYDGPSNSMLIKFVPHPALAPEARARVKPHEIAVPLPPRSP